MWKNCFELRTVWFHYSLKHRCHRVKTQDGTHRTRCEQGPILGSARRRLETEWRSWCTGGRFESRNSQFSFSNGNMLSSQHIRLQREEGDRERDAWGQSKKSWNIQGKKPSISTSNSLKTSLEVVAGHQNKWCVSICWSEQLSHAWKHSKVIVTIDNLSIKNTTNSYIPFSDAASQWCCLQFYDPRQWKFPLSTSPLCHVHNLCSKDMRKTFCHSPRCFFAGKIQTGAEMAPILVFPQL